MTDDAQTHAQRLDDRKRQIGKRIKSLRVGLRMSQPRLAEVMQLSVQAISQWEVGKSIPDIVRLEMLSSLMKTDISYILTGESVFDKIERPNPNIELLAINLSEAGDFFYNENFDRDLAREKYLYIIPTFLEKDQQFAFQIDDDSMRPEFSPGDVIVIQSRLFPLPGDYVVYMTRETNKFGFRKFRLKHMLDLEADIMEFYPINTDYPSEFFKDTSVVDIQGTMVEHRRFRRR